VCDIVDIRRSVVGVVTLYFACVQNKLPIKTTSVAEPDDSPSGKQVGQCNSELVVCYVAATHGRVAPSASIASRSLVFDLTN